MPKRPRKKRIMFTDLPPEVQTDVLATARTLAERLERALAQLKALQKEG